MQVNPLFNVTIAGPAEVEIFEGPTFMVDTATRLQINGTVSGQPDPDISLYSVENGREVLISNNHPRITVDFVPTKLTIAIEDVRVNDSGEYRVKASNEVGGTSADFMIETRGESIANVYMNLSHVYCNC